jgi:hypothetical protein
MEQCCGPLAVEIFPGNTSISVHILPRDREISLAHAQRCSFLIMEESCDPLSVEFTTGKHYDFSNNLAKRARAQSCACAEVQFPDYGTVLLSLAVQMFPGNTEISAPILPTERELSLAHVQR